MLFSLTLSTKSFSCDDHHGAKAKKTAQQTQFGAPLGTVQNDQIVEAKVLEVCPKKGCWMRVETTEGKESFVRFKDYGFFVPTNLKGKTIRMSAVTVEKTVSEKELKHFLEDAKATKEEIEKVSGPTTRTEFLATGVEVVK